MFAKSEKKNWTKVKGRMINPQPHIALPAESIESGDRYTSVT